MPTSLKRLFKSSAVTSRERPETCKFIPGLEASLPPLLSLPCRTTVTSTNTKHIHACMHIHVSKSKAEITEVGQDIPATIPTPVIPIPIPIVPLLSLFLDLLSGGSSSGGLRSTARAIFVSVTFTSVFC